MSTTQNMTVGALGVVLVWALGLTVFVTSLHLTVLDPGFVKTAVEEEGGYELVLSQVEKVDENGGFEVLSKEVSLALNESTPVNSTRSVIDPGMTVEHAVPEAYLASETEKNVDSMYSFLHGDSENLNLTLDVEPIKDNITKSVKRQVINASIADQLAGTNESIGGLVNASMIAQLTSNESGFHTARAAFRSNIEDQVLQSMVSDRIQQATINESLQLGVEGYDASAYNSTERQALFESNLPAIRSAYRDRIQSQNASEVNNRVDQQLSAINDQYGEYSGSGLEGAVVRVQVVILNGLTEDMTYREFDSFYRDAKAWLALEISDIVDSRLDSVYSDQIDLDSHLGTTAKKRIDETRYFVEWLDLIIILLPLVIVGLLALMYKVTGSVTGVAKMLGMGMMWAGLPTYVGVTFTRTNLEGFVSALGFGSPEAVEVLSGIFGRILGTMGQVALVMGLGGLAIVVFLAYINSALEERLQDVLEERIDGQVEDTTDE